MKGTTIAFPLLQNLDCEKPSTVRVCRTLSSPSLLRSQASRVILGEIALGKEKGDVDRNNTGQPKQGKKCMGSDTIEVNPHTWI